MNKCTFCNFQGDFLPVDTRKKAACPVCGSMERHRLIQSTCGLDLAKNKNAHILHLSPAPCWSYFFKNHNFYFTMNMDLCFPPFVPKSFDYIIAVHIFEHIEADVVAMKQAFEILRPDGKLITMVPQSSEPETFEDNRATTEEDRLKLFGNKGHVRIYGQDFKSRLEIAGFKVEVVEALKSDTFNLGKEKLYIGGKK